MRALVLYTALAVLPSMGTVSNTKALSYLNTPLAAVVADNTAPYNQGYHGGDYAKQGTDGGSYANKGYGGTTWPETAQPGSDKQPATQGLPGPPRPAAPDPLIPHPR
jgi:hypothetical protein